MKSFPGMMVGCLVGNQRLFNLGPSGHGANVANQIQSQWSLNLAIQIIAHAPVEHRF
jgi:hypothetical protein